MRKTIIKFLTSTLFTFVLLTGAFYFFILKPKLILPSKLITAEEIISTNHLNLVQNRLSMMGLTKLEPNSPYLAGDKKKLLEKALETNARGLEDLKNPPLISKLEETSSLNTKELFKLNKEILEKQQSLLEGLQTLGDINANIFSYNPIADLGTLDLQSEGGREKVIERSYNAMEGLEKIRKDLEGIKDSGNVEALIQKIWTTSDLINTQIDQIKGENYEDASLTFYDVYNNFGELKEMGLNLEKDILRSATSVELLTEETNLMLKYEFILEKINELQAALPKVDLYSLFR